MTLRPDFDLDYNVFAGYIVYVWKRDEIALYVGSSTVGIARLSAAHHCINKKERFLPYDRLEIYVCQSKGECLDLELELIKSLEPFYNKKHSLREQKVRVQLEESRHLDKIRKKIPQSASAREKLDRKVLSANTEENWQLRQALNRTKV